VKIYKKFYKTNVDKNNVFTVFNDICKTYYEEQYDDAGAVISLDEEPISFDEVRRIRALPEVNVLVAQTKNKGENPCSEYF
jgi:hypothetical protein